VEELQAASGPKNVSPTPGNDTQVVRDSVLPEAPNIPPALAQPRAQLIFEHSDLSSPSPPASDAGLPPSCQMLEQSVESLSDKEEEEEDADFDIEWRVMIDKQPLIMDVISRSEFYFATRRMEGIEQEQVVANKKGKDVVDIHCNVSITSPRGKPVEL
jgi:hypothetical protein